MTLNKKWPFFVMGAFMGTMIALVFFGWRKDISFPYLPESRVKHALLNDSAIYISEPDGFAKDSVRKWIKESEVIFSESEPRRKPCKFYVLRNKINNNRYSVEYCIANNEILFKLTR